MLALDLAWKSGNADRSPDKNGREMSSQAEKLPHWQSGIMDGPPVRPSARPPVRPYRLSARQHIFAA